MDVFNNGELVIYWINDWGSTITR